MQYPLGIPPNLRTNIDYVFILRENYLSNRKKIWENYASMFPTLESFCSIMDQTTENYECMVMINITFQCLNYTIFNQTFLSDIIKSVLFKWAQHSLKWV